MSSGEEMKDVTGSLPMGEFSVGQAPASQKAGKLSGRHVKKKKPEETTLQRVPSSHTHSAPSETGVSFSAKRRKTDDEVPPALLHPSPASSGQESRTAFAGPHHAPMLTPFEARLQEILSTPDRASIPMERIAQIVSEGEQQVDTLYAKQKFSRAKDLAEKLLLLTPQNSKLKFSLLNCLLHTANRTELLAYAKKCMNDPSFLPTEKWDIATYLFWDCCNACDYSNAIEFAREQLKIPPTAPEFIFDTATIEARIKQAEVQLQEYRAINDTQVHPSPISGVSQEQFSLLTLLGSELSTLSPEQKQKLTNFFAFCIGNKELSKKLREASESPAAVHALVLALLPLQLSGSDNAMIGRFYDRGAQLSSVKVNVLGLANVLKEISVISYKTQRENIEKYMKALDKLSSILEKLQLHQDFLAYSRLARSFQGHGEQQAPGFPSLEQLFSPEEISKSQQRFSQEASFLGAATIAPSDRLTGPDLLALNSLINLRDTLLGYRNLGILPDHPLVNVIIEQGIFAEGMIQKLTQILGAGYQTGDLSFRNLHKFDALTGKSQGWLMNLYSMISPFGHAAMIDQTMDLQTISYSEVLAAYTYRAVPLEEFFTTDLYRLNVSSLFTEEGKALLSARLDNLKKLGLVSPLITFDQYVQETFISHLETILAGSEITEVPIAELEQFPETPEEEELLEVSRKRRVQEYHEQAFGTIQNDGMLQLRAGISPFHRPVCLPWSTPPSGPNFREVKLEGRMICSQFQALAILKALTQTQDTVYQMMAEQVVRGDLETPRISGEDPVAAQLREKTPDEQQAYDAALTGIRERNLFLIPVSTREKPQLLTPKRVVSLLQQHLMPVPMDPVARQVLDLPEQFFKTALFT